MDTEKLNGNIECSMAYRTAGALAAHVKWMYDKHIFNIVERLFIKDKNAADNLKYLTEVGNDLVSDVCIPNLSESADPAAYSCSEELLKLIASVAPTDDILIGILEMVEDQESDVVFTTALSALQSFLLKVGDDNIKAFEWSLNSVACALAEMKFPDFLTKDFDIRQRALLEQVDQVDQLFLRYIPTGFFYDPLVKDVLDKSMSIHRHATFRICGRKNRRNLLICFLVRLLDIPLALLDCSAANADQQTNTYTLQIIKQAAMAITQLATDPYFFLNFAERRCVRTRGAKNAKPDYGYTNKNIFMIAECLPIIGLSTYYFLVFVEKIVDLTTAPKVYAPLFLFESCSYLCAELLEQDEPVFQLRGLHLLDATLDLLGSTRIRSACLDFGIHTNVFHIICDVMGGSSAKAVKGFAASLLGKYIKKFDDEGRYLIISNLMRTSSPLGLQCHVTYIYKDCVHAALLETGQLPPQYCGENFSTIVRNYICYLPHGARSDLLEMSEKISTALNFIYYCAQRDTENRTGLWDIMNELADDYLKPLRSGLNLSIAHYKTALHNSQQGLDAQDIEKHRELFKNMRIITDENAADNGNGGIQITSEQKISVLERSLCNFELIHDRLGMVMNSIENYNKLNKIIKEKSSNN